MILCILPYFSVCIIVQIAKVLRPECFASELINLLIFSRTADRLTKVYDSDRPRLLTFTELDPAFALKRSAVLLT